MSKQPHPWVKVRDGSAPRFATGLVLALAFVLVAFEWKGDGPAPMQPWDDLPFEDDIQEYPKVVIIERQAASQPVHKQRSSRVVVGDPDPILPPTPDPDPAPTPGPGTPDPGPPVVDPNPPEHIDPMPTPWNGVEQKPYFKECLGGVRSELDECTEARIARHLQRYFEVPEEMRREEFTIVTFEIDATGRIGKLVCVPKPSPAVLHEIERVVRRMPVFEPGTQNGLPVPVIYQLPFRVRRI